MNLAETIKHVQKSVGVDADGIAGPKTWAAIALKVGMPLKHLEAPCKVMDGDDASTAKVDDRSEKSIATLQPNVRNYARALVHRAAEQGIVIKIISGTRNEAEQNALYAKGRTAPGSIVTNAKFGYSNHNFGLAFDVGIFQGSSYLGSSPLYKVIGALGRELGLEWGGDWKSFKDEPHFQLRPVWAKSMSESQMLAELRAGRSIS